MKQKDKMITFLGKDAELDGNLTFEGTIHIDGHFKGKISADGNLIVGEDGLIEADIHISYIRISGEIHGNIYAHQKVDIHAPGKVFGNIHAPAVVIDEGVIFEGMTRMYQAKGADEKNLSAIGSDDYIGTPPSSLTAIYGIVTDQITGNPIKNAKVRCSGADDKNTQTNASGYYEVINLKDGEWKLKIGAKGYKSKKAKVGISSEGMCEQNIELKPKRWN